MQAIAQILDQLVTLPYLNQLEFLISSGSDPLTSLQGKRDRQNYLLSAKPGDISRQLETQIVYTFTRGG